MDYIAIAIGAFSVGVYVGAWVERRRERRRVEQERLSANTRYRYHYGPGPFWVE